MSSTHAQEQDKAKRRLKNFFLQPALQVKIGFYAIILAFIFTVVILAALYLNFYRFYEMVLELTDLRDEVSQLVNAYLRDVSWWLVGSILVYVIANVLLSVLITHRLVGPTYAFRRHIKNLIDGKFESRVTLRKNDAFTEVAEDLNQLAETLERKNSK